MKKGIYAILILGVIVLIACLILIKHDVQVVSNIEIDMPYMSGAVSNLPWLNNDQFLKAQKKTDAYTLMAAYCTVFESSSLNEEHNVQLAASSLSGVIIEPNEVFSQNNTIGPYDEEKGYKAGQSYIGSKITTTIGGGVCKLATTLYNVAVASNLEIVERYNHFMPVSYVPYGQDATVSYGSKDLKFRNITDSPILIWAEAIDNRLFVSFYGQQKAPNVKWNHKISNRIDAPKVYKSNPSLPEGVERTLVKGMEGALVESWVIISYPEGDVETKHMGVSQYWPMPHVIESCH